MDVSEHSGYHHGEASLNGTIINMAQNFMGSNNINLFCPTDNSVQDFKVKILHLKIYLYKLESITRFIFPKEDDVILEYIDDDGQMVEPIYYAPILPMILNGTKGIGTGFSTEIMCHNPFILLISFKLN